MGGGADFRRSPRLGNGNDDRTRARALNGLRACRPDLRHRRASRKHASEVVQAAHRASSVASGCVGGGTYRSRPKVTQLRFRTRTTHFGRESGRPGALPSFISDGALSRPRPIVDFSGHSELSHRVGRLVLCTLYCSGMRCHQIVLWNDTPDHRYFGLPEQSTQAVCLGYQSACRSPGRCGQSEWRGAHIY